MAEEHKDEAAKSEEETKVDDSKNADGEGEAKADTTPNPYEELLAKEKERADKAEKAIAAIAFKNREKKHDKEDEKDDEGEEDKPLTAKEINKILDQERQRTRKELQVEVITEKAKKLAGSDAEASLIIEIHKNRTFPDDLSLDEQLEEAYAIANRGKILAENAELRRKARSKDTATDAVAGSHRDSQAADAPKLSAGDAQALHAVGYVWDGKIQRYVKISGNYKLIHDPKNPTNNQRILIK